MTQKMGGGTVYKQILITEKLHLEREVKRQSSFEEVH
jgi:hypothetical protein